MADFIISPYAISFESIRNNLQLFVQSKPEEDGWLDFYASSAGETVIEIASALGTFYAYQFIAGRREAFISTAQNYSSLLGLAQNLGYSVGRGTNTQIEIEIIPSVTGTLPKWEVVGAYAEYDLVLMDDVTLNAGVKTTIPVIVGNRYEESVDVLSSDLTTFMFANSDVTDTYRLLLSRENTVKELPSSTEIKDAVNDKYICITNTLGSLDVFYLQQGKENSIYKVAGPNGMGWTTVKGEKGEPLPYTANVYNDDLLYKKLANPHNYIFSASGDLANALKLETYRTGSYNTDYIDDLHENVVLQDMGVYGNTYIVVIDNDRQINLTFTQEDTIGDIIKTLKEHNILLEITRGYDGKRYLHVNQMNGTYNYTGDYVGYNNYYRHGDKLILQYISRNQVNFNSIERQHLSIPYASRVDEIHLVLDLIEKESEGSIRMKSPIYHETAMIVRSRKDYCKLLLESNADIIAVSDRDIYPGLIEITYIKKDGGYLTDEEKDLWEERLKLSTPSGVAISQISNSVMIHQPLRIRLWSDKTGSVTQTAIETRIRSILDSYNNKFGVAIDIPTIEQSIERLDGVKIARIEMDKRAWSPNTNFAKYEIAQTEDGRLYYVHDFKHYSGNVEPTWCVNDGETVTDGGLIWKKVDECKDVIIHDWKPNTYYKKHDYIRKNYVVLKELKPYSGVMEPRWGDDVVNDNNLKWVRVYSASVEPKVWKPMNQYAITDVIEVADGDYLYRLEEIRQETSTETFVYVVDDYANYTSSMVPNWGDRLVYDNNIVWERLGTTSISDTWQRGKLTFIGDEINVKGVLYKCIAYRRKTGESMFDQESTPFFDNEIEWKEIDDNAKKYELGWNEHIDFTFTCSIED